jgi:hypothetical protein
VIELRRYVPSTMFEVQIRKIDQLAGRQPSSRGAAPQATQIPGTATFSKACGAATVLSG